MKFTLLFLITLTTSLLSHSQNVSEIKQVMRDLETYMPKYIILNYCEQYGLVNLFREAQLDDRVIDLEVKQTAWEYMGVRTDTTITITYNKSRLSFDKMVGAYHIFTYSIYFLNEKDRSDFIRLYIKLMEFTQDPEDPNRYYNLSMDKGMNAISSLDPVDSTWGYIVSCFVYQRYFCPNPPKFYRDIMTMHND